MVTLKEGLIESISRNVWSMGNRYFNGDGDIPSLYLHDNFLVLAQLQKVVFQSSTLL